MKTPPIPHQGFTAICIFVNKKIEARQVPILVENGNRVRWWWCRWLIRWDMRLKAKKNFGWRIAFQVVLHCSAGFDNSPTTELKAAGIKAIRVKYLAFWKLAELQEKKIAYVQKVFGVFVLNWSQQVFSCRCLIGLGIQSFQYIKASSWMMRKNIQHVYLITLFLPGAVLLSRVNRRVCDCTNHGPSQEHPLELCHDQEGKLWSDLHAGENKWLLYPTKSSKTLQCSVFCWRTRSVGFSAQVRKAFYYH